MIRYSGTCQASGRRDVFRTCGRETVWLTRPEGRPSRNKLDWRWGDDSPGSRELALAILFDWGMPMLLAEMWADQFLADVVSKLSGLAWWLDGEDLGRWLVEALVAEMCFAPCYNGEAHQ